MSSKGSMRFHVEHVEVIRRACFLARRFIMSRENYNNMGLDANGRVELKKLFKAMGTIIDRIERYQDGYDDEPTDD